MSQNIEKEKVALLRHACILPVINKSPDDPRPNEEIFEQIALEGVYDRESGSRRYFAVPTLKRYYRTYLKGGFDALKPKDRSDATSFRKIDEELFNKIVQLKTEYPRMSASGIRRRLLKNGDIKADGVSLSTITRCVHRVIKTMNHKEEKPEMRRYERAHINDVWCADTSVGPYIKLPEGTVKTYVIALIDDASRMITGIDVFTRDTYVNFTKVMKSAVLKYGVPQRFNLDNGTVYKNHQMKMLSARLGSELIYNRPYTPTAKAKVERFFGTMKRKWMAEINPKQFKSVEDVRQSLLRWVNEYNKTPHSSLVRLIKTGSGANDVVKGKAMTPNDRFFSEASIIRRLGKEGDELDKLFMLELQRRVSIDGVVNINNLQYEVNGKYSRKKIAFRYSPDFKQIYLVDPEDGALVPVKLLDKEENATAKRRFYFSNAEDIKIARGVKGEEPDDKPAGESVGEQMSDTPQELSSSGGEETGPELSDSHENERSATPDTNQKSQTTKN